VNQIVLCSRNETISKIAEGLENENENFVLQLKQLIRKHVTNFESGCIFSLEMKQLFLLFYI
jgi:23S rRNA maturation-related 3'-5' exoribonuclease YhaM